MNKLGQVWTNLESLNLFLQILTNSSNVSPIYTSFNKFDILDKFQHVWISSTNIERVQTILDKFQQVVMNLARLYILGWVTGAFSMKVRLILWRFPKIDYP